MSLLNKVSEAPFICKIALDFSGALLPFADEDFQNFFNSIGNQYTWLDAHFGKKSVSFSESEQLTKSGSVFSQTLQIKVPNADHQKTVRLAYIKKAKFVRIELSNGLILVMGRNDYFQNKNLEIVSNANHNSYNIKFSTKSLFSIGHLRITDVSPVIDFILPSEIPNNFISI